MIAAEVTVASPDFGHLEPMVAAAERELAAAGVTDSPRSCSPTPATGTRSRWSAITGRGIQVLIPPDASRRKGARPGWDGGAYTMRGRLATDRGGELYRRRQPMIEPVFGHTKFNRRFDRFHRRGRSAARTEWRLIAATHNLLELSRHSLAPMPPEDRPGGCRPPPTRRLHRLHSSPRARLLYATASPYRSSRLHHQMPFSQLVVTLGAHRPDANLVLDLVGGSSVAPSDSPRGVALRAGRIRSRRVAAFDDDPTLP